MISINLKKGMKDLKKALKKAASLLLCALIVFSALINGLSVLAEEAEIVSVTAVAQNTVVEGTNGYLTTDADRNLYWEYYPSAFNIIATVNYDDGSSISGTLDEIANRTGLWTSYRGGQVASPWKAGDNIQVIEIGSHSVNVICTVTESDIESISAVCDKPVIEGTNGYESNRWNYETNVSEEYWRYDTYNLNVIYTITFKDGSTVSGSKYSSNVSEALGGLEISVYANQSSNPWTVGENTAYAYLGGEICEFTCTVIETPVASISAVSTKDIIENTNGYESRYWDDEKEEYVPYWCYHTSDSEPIITVNYKDGSVFTGTRDELYQKTNWEYGVSFYENETPWGVGEHTATLSFMGVSCEFVCNIIESPYESISVVTTKSVMEYMDGHESSYWEGGEEIRYWRYRIEDFGPIVTVHLKDGSEIVGTTEDIYEQTGINVSFSENQSEEPWQAGENRVLASFGNLTYEFSCTVLASPIKSISAIVEPILEHGKGTYDGSSKTFYYHPDNINAVLTIEYEDGRTDTAYYNSEYRYFKGSPIYFMGSFESQGFALGEGNTVSFKYRGKQCTATVELLENPAKDYKYFEQDGGIYITQYMGTDTEVEIPSEINGLPVVGLGLDSYCYSFNNIESLIIPDSVKYIDCGFFRYYYSLKNIRIGSGVTYIGPTLFLNCSELTQIRVSDNNPYYCDVWGVLYSKDKTEFISYPLGMGSSYTFPSYVTDISNVTLYEYCDVSFSFAGGNSEYVTIDGVTYTSDMTKLVSADQSVSGEYIMPDTVTEIERDAFCGNTNITSVIFSDNVTEITYAAFGDCSSLTYVELPDSLISISDYAFGQTGLTSLTLPENTERIGAHTFEGTPLTSVEFNEGLLSIGYYAFGYTRLTELELPETLEIIGGNAFSYTDIKNLTLPDSLREISSSFEQCLSLASVTFGDGLETIGEEAFNNCTALTDINFSNSIKTISKSAFANCTALKELTMSDSITELQTEAFASCSALSDIRFSTGGLSIGHSAFSDCASIKELNLPENLIYIGKYAFDKCINIKQVTVPESVEKIDMYAFNECTSIEKVTLKNNNTKVRYSAFYGCPVSDPILYGNTGVIDEGEFYNKDFESLIIPDSVTKITYGAFASCGSLKEIDCPDSVISISSYAFMNTPWYDSQEEGMVYLGKTLYDYKGEIRGEQTVSFDRYIRGIGDYSFDKAIASPELGFVKVVLPEGLEHIGKGAFRHCTALSSVYIPDSVYSIDYMAFTGCYNLTELLIDPENPYFVYENGAVYTLDKTRLIFCMPNLDGEFVVPSSVKEIVSFAFAGCDDVTSIKIPSTVTKIENFAFGVLPDDVLEIYSDENGAIYNVDEFDICQAVKIICAENSAAYNYAKENRLPIETMIECAHKYTSSVVAPTCTKVGYTLHTCSKCGDSYTSDNVAALGHTFEDGFSVDIYPTCTASGQISRHCSVCKDTVDIIAVDKIAHAGGIFKTVKSPDCENAGTLNEYCADCGEFVRVVNVPATHKHSLWSWIMAPAGGKEGVKTRSCADCGKTETVMSLTLDNKGDINEDAQVNVKDLIGMKKIAAGLKGYLTVADMSGDNICTALDLVLLRKYILGIR